MFCGNCGKQIDDHSVFCPYCGAACGDKPQTQQNHYESTGSSGKNPANTLIYCLIGFIVVLLIAAIAFLGVSLHNSNTQDTTEAISKDIPSSGDGDDVTKNEVAPATDTVDPAVTTAPVTAAATATPPLPTPIATATPVPAAAAAVYGDYILPSSSSVYLTRSDVLALLNSNSDSALFNSWYVPYRTNPTTSDFNGYTMYLARNEIAARHGRSFGNTDLQAYFGSKSWYVGDTSAEYYDSNVDWILTDVEKANAQLIQSIEGEYGYTGKY